MGQHIKDIHTRLSFRSMLGIMGVVVAIIIARWPPPMGLNPKSMIGLGILAWAIIWWVLNILPEYVTALIMTLLFLLFSLVPMQTAFASFVSPTWWLLFAAYGLGVGITKSGLLTRIALITLRLFPKNLKGQILGLIGAGVVTGPLIPSITAKAAILAPVAMAMSDSLGYSRKGKEASALFLAMFTGIRNIAPVVISASVIGYLVQGLLPIDVQTRFNLGYWFICALPWGIIISTLNYWTIKTMYVSRDANPCDTGFITERIKALGPFRNKERLMLYIILIMVLLWATEPLHGIAAQLVGMIGFCAILAFGIVERADFRQAIAWDSLIFIGVVMNISTVFEALGINTWIVTLFEPVMRQMANNAYVFVLGLALITVLLRFIIVSELAFVSIFMAFAVPLAIQVGINPWVVGMVIYCMVNPWLVLYQNPTYLTALYATNGDMVDHREMARFCVFYLVNSLIGLLISVPYWQFLKLMP